MKTEVFDTGALTNREMLLAAYAAYNRRDSDALIALVSEDVNWPDGSAGLHGKAEVRAYWTRQWAVTGTHDEPVRITDLLLDFYKQNRTTQKPLTVHHKLSRA
jgi:ketosteroid isomerase-like protein